MSPGPTTGASMNRCESWSYFCVCVFLALLKGLLGMILYCSRILKQIQVIQINALISYQVNSPLLAFLLVFTYCTRCSPKLASQLRQCLIVYQLIHVLGL